VTLGVPREDFLMRRFTTPPVSARNLPELVGFEIERHLPGKREEFLCGWRVEGRAGAGHAVLLGAARAQAIDRSLSLLRRANLAPVSVQPEPFALSHCLKSASPRLREALVLDLGPGQCGIDLIRAGRLVLTMVAPIDDPRWRESLVPPPPGTGASTEPAAVLRQAAAEQLGAALSARLSAPLFRESISGDELPALWLTGYGANRAPLIAKLESALKVPVRTFTPWPMVRWSAPASDLDAYSHALELAFAGPHAGRSGIELAAERQDELHRAPSRRLTAALAILLGLVLAAHLIGYGVRQQRELALVDREIRDLKLRMTEVEAVNRDVQERRSRFDYLKTTVLGRARQADILRELTGLLPDSAYLSELTYRDRTVEITGLAPSASQLLPVLEASPLFVGVEFSAPIVAQGAGLERFRIRLRMESSGG